MALTYRKHQHEGIHFILNNRRLGAKLWHEMGLGKTASSLEATRQILGYLRANGARNPKFMVMMPKSATVTWRKECMDNFPDMWQSMVMMPYSRVHEEAQILAHQDIRVIIFDEWHYVKNPESKRADNIASCLRNIGSRNGMFEGGKLILLTGTPMPNSAAEWYTGWAVMSAPNILEAATRLTDPVDYKKWTMTFAKKTMKTFKSRFGEEQRPSYSGVDHTQQLTRLLAPFTHLRKTKDCLDMPDKNVIPIDLGIPDDKLLADANIEEPEAYMALLERLSRAKTPHLIEWVKDFLEGTDEQLVVFSMYLEPLYQLQEKYKDDVLIIVGDEKVHERESSVLAFQKSKKRIIAMTYATGAESLNLQVAYKTLYHGYPWTDGKLKQAMARTWRQGQNYATFHYFLCSGYNDMRILGLVRSKEEATTEVEQSLQLFEEQNRLSAQSLDDLF